MGMCISFNIAEESLALCILSLNVSFNKGKFSSLKNDSLMYLVPAMIVSQRVMMLFSDQRQQVRLVSAEAELPNHPLHKMGVASQPGGGGSSITMMQM